MTLPASKVCELCGATFPRLATYQYTQWKVRRFCSRTCAARASAAARPLIPCPECGDRLVRPTTQRCNRCSSRYQMATNPVWQERDRRAKRLFKERHPDYWKQEKHRERARRNAAKYRQENPEATRAAVRAGKMVRRAREAGVERDPHGIVGPWAEVLRRDPCAYCGGPGGSVDHVDPIALGGGHLVENLTGCCAACNSSKRATPLLPFLLHRTRRQA